MRGSSAPDGQLGPHRDRRHVNAGRPYAHASLLETHMKAKYLFSLVIMTVMYFTIAVLLSPQAHALFA